MQHSKLFSLCRLLLIAPVLVLFLSGCAPQVQTTSSESQSSVSTPSKITINDTSFSATDGSINVRNISVTIGEAVVGGDINPSPEEIHATVLNNTTSTFESIVFDVALISNEGREVANQKVSVTDRTSPGSVAQLNYPLASTMYGEVEYREGMTFGIDLSSANYVAQYTFDLKNGNNLIFESDSLSIQFRPTKEGISFKMQNKTNKSIQIKWDRVSYVDIEGSSHPVIKSGTRYSERNETLKPTSIAPNSFVEDVIFPADYIDYNSYSNEYRKEDLFPNGEESQKYEGETFSIYMPLSVGESDVNLNFSFEITDVSY